MSEELTSKNQITPDAVATLCQDKFESLPKTGKPGAEEWTVVSGIVLHDSLQSCNKVVALGAGTKCIGQLKLDPLGYTLNDSHAEVLARRALLRFFYYELNCALMESRADSLFSWNSEISNFVLRSGVSFHFFSTQIPCGDACISPEKETEQELPRKRSKLEIDSVFTGAKLIGDTCDDAMLQTLGAARTKPGRGDRTLSMSCSDKLAKWNLLGVQGALLDALLHAPVYLKSFNFCGDGNKASVKRAIFDRFAESTLKHERYQAFSSNLGFCTHNNFKYQQSTQRTKPSPNGLAWCDIPKQLKPYEISVNGKRQGVTTKKLNTYQSALKISKYSFFQEFINLIRNKKELMKKLNLSNDKLDDITYFKLKQVSVSYQKVWSEAKTQYFQQWTTKPEQLLYFSLNKFDEHKVIGQ